MRVSRLRLKLSSGFAIAFTIGLILLATGALGYLWRESNRRFDKGLEYVVSGVAAALAREFQDTPDSSLAYVSREVAAKWPGNGDGFLVLDANGNLVGSLDQQKLSAQVLRATRQNPRVRRQLLDGEPPTRVLVVDTVIATRSLPIRARVVAFGSSEGIDRDVELLSLVLLVSLPAIVVFSLVCGYLVSGRALLPVHNLAASISAINPSDLARRIEDSGGDDEIGTLASEFNSLLDRLEESQENNRRFVREAAHQIRTPLTLVLGEADHALSQRNGSEGRFRDAVGRIRIAAEQMRRRVDELFLLAEAEAGEAPRLEEEVELDGLLLECLDLMRARAATTAHGLSIESADHAVVMGNSALLREVVLELLENACRHGTPGGEIVTSVVRGKEIAAIEVTSTGNSFSLPTVKRSDGSKLGLSIVQWVTQSHRGELSVTHDGNRNHVLLRLPLLLRQNA